MKAKRFHKELSYSLTDDCHSHTARMLLGVILCKVF